MSERFDQTFRIDENGKCRLMTDKEREERQNELYRYALFTARNKDSFIQDTDNNNNKTKTQNEPS